MKQYLQIKGIRGGQPLWAKPQASPAQIAQFQQDMYSLLDSVVTAINDITDPELLNWDDLIGVGNFYVAGTPHEITMVTSPAPVIHTSVRTWTGIETMGFDIRITNAFLVGSSPHICEELEWWVRQYVQEWLRNATVDWKYESSPSLSATTVLIEYQPDDLVVMEPVV